MNKNSLKFFIFLVVFGLIGGYFTALCSVEILTPEALEQAVNQVGSIDALILITTLQSLLYAIILGFIGRAISRKIGLWREFTIEPKPLAVTLMAALLGGAFFILADAIGFARLIPSVLDSYATKPTLNYIIASVTYGGVVEEIMLRLFWMSLVALILSWLSKEKTATEKHFIIANIISALMFAAGHLPATIQSIGLTPIILIRCFVMNGAFGLLFGRIYRKHGIGYAMIAHAGVHIVSKIIWFLFI